MLRRVRADDREQGETLLEIVISLAVLSVVVVAVFAAIVLAIKFAGVHRSETKAADYLRNYAEAIESQVAGGGYTASCTPGYASSYSTGDSSFSAPKIAAVSFWTGTGWTPTPCTGTNTTGLEQLTLQISTTDGRVTENLVIVVRTTCSTGTNCT